MLVLSLDFILAVSQHQLKSNHTLSDKVVQNAFGLSESVRQGNAWTVKDIKNLAGCNWVLESERLMLPSHHPTRLESPADTKVRLYLGCRRSSITFQHPTTLLSHQMPTIPPAHATGLQHRQALSIPDLGSETNRDPCVGIRHRLPARDPRRRWPRATTLWITRHLTPSRSNPKSRIGAMAPIAGSFDRPVGTHRRWCITSGSELEGFGVEWGLNMLRVMAI